MLTSGLQESYFTKRQPAAAPQSFEKEAALVQASIGGTGQLVPVREVTRLDSSDPARQNIELENGIERTVEPKEEDPQSEQKSRSQPQAGLRAASPPRMLRSTHGRITPAPADRGAKRVGGNSHTAVSLRVPKPPSTRRMTSLAAGPRGAAAQAAQSYINAANREMDKGNYMAAITNYKRALHVDGNSSAAKSRLGRARRAMQAEHEIIASRR
jgi:hypothetical protein